MSINGGECSLAAKCGCIGGLNGGDRRANTKQFPQRAGAEGAQQQKPPKADSECARKSRRKLNLSTDEAPKQIKPKSLGKYEPVISYMLQREKKYNPLISALSFGRRPHTCMQFGFPCY
ncbi:dEAD/DEAH box helicase domain-containing protein [Anopheles sinensis]|uniref:DEAD/DEAH box helicase domain-containing protein n=1 Tax=Anopheles sinensis TaxID=74873 RepID=A0A084VT99_ANOSI|nr:dEAD/DEAH box helicase domain-containing protein [Anopheles sinensis]